MTSIERLNRIRKRFHNHDGRYDSDEDFDIIEKDLEVLEIVKKKDVAIDELKNCIKHDSKYRPALEEYNAFIGDENSLTQEEFELLKEWLER